ncbi:MAG: 50S ribosomal protein L11 methyltransferase [Pseudomonadota bacterium]|nr:50S ribosomal protein L11 methyltransferase [Pseudomonadota bacterium]
MNPRSKANPFAQSPQYWKVSFTLPSQAVEMAENAFDDSALAVSAFEADGDKHLWTFELLQSAMPDMTEIQRRLLVLSMLHEFPTPSPVVQRVEAQDWVKQVARSFPPMAIGRFYVHGSHVTRAPAASLPIQVDAGAAFGSGEHGTTHGCLEAIDWLGKRRRFRCVLDMGCGSGILAIAAAKLFRTEVLAADVDPIAVRVAAENTRINREQGRVTCIASDGYASDTIRRRAPFDLILSNILARPLIAFAPDLARSLAPHGFAVLSGLLVSQEAQVLSAHLMQGLKLVKRFPHEEWSTLVLKR